MPMRIGAPAASDALVLRNFTLIDGGDHAVVSPAAMVVEQGRVAWVGPEANLEAPDGAPVNVLNGAFVIPGLIDMHAHVGNTVDLVFKVRFTDKPIGHHIDRSRNLLQELFHLQRDTFDLLQVVPFGRAFTEPEELMTIRPGTLPWSIWSTDATPGCSTSVPLRRV